MTVKGEKKKQNCLLCQRLEASKAAQNLSEILATPEFGKLLEMRVMLILHYLLTDLLLIQIKLAILALVRPSP